MQNSLGTASPLDEIEVEMMILSTCVVSLREEPVLFDLNATEKFKLGHF